MQTTQPKKYLRWTNDLRDNGHMLPIPINYKVIRHTLPYVLRDNYIYDYSYTYNILSHLFIGGYCRYASLLTIVVTILWGEVVTLLIKL